jgi:putative Mg2+ transporter-C (MgtC) family protein
VSTAIDPAELDAVVAELQRGKHVEHATWEVSTKD